MTSMMNTNSPKTPVLSVEDLCVTFRQEGRSAQIVRNVSFSVEPGRCLGILGESGSGKSMSCKAVLRLLDRNFEVTGRITFMGEDLAARSGEEIRRMRGSRITMVLQNPMNCFDPLYRIGEQMAETFREHTDWSASKIREESLSILSQMRIASAEEVLRKYPHQLSGGMLQRVMIGLAIKLRPDLIVCDEPTTAVDSISRYAIMQEFLRIKAETGAAMIFISHDLGVLNMIARRPRRHAPRPHHRVRHARGGLRACPGSLHARAHRPPLRSHEGLHGRNPNGRTPCCLKPGTSGCPSERKTRRASSGASAPRSSTA